MTPLLEVAGLTKVFANGVRAVQDVSFSLDRGHTLGIVGESGCGKSTTAKLIMRILRPDSGRILFDGDDVTNIRGHRLRALRRRIQLVPQNPSTSLNPKLTVAQSIEFNLRAGGWERTDRRARILELLGQVGLNAGHAERYPHQLSGGQCQRVAIARALSTKPDLIVFDEAVSALDKSVQAQVLNMLGGLQEELALTCVFISHDLSVIEHIADEVMVMYLGRIIEAGSTEATWLEPLHPYTQALLSAVPGKGADRIVLAGDPPNPADPPSGCSFHQRCSRAMSVCATTLPLEVAVNPRHSVSCVHYAAQPLATGAAS